MGRAQRGGRHGCGDAAEGGEPWGGYADRHGVEVTHGSRRLVGRRSAEGAGATGGAKRTRARWVLLFGCTDKKGTYSSGNESMTASRIPTSQISAW